MTAYYCNASTGDDTNDGLSEGNAFKSPGKAAATATSTGDKIWLKNAADYVLTSSTPNADEGPVSLATDKEIHIEGYSTTIGDGGLAVIDAGAITNVTLLSMDGTFSGSNMQTAKYIICDGNSGSSNIGFSLTGTYLGEVRAIHCAARDCVTGFTGGSRGVCIGCTATSCTTGFIVRIATYCLAEDCTGTGFAPSDSGGVDISMCIADTCNLGFVAGAAAYNTTFRGCIAYGCTSHGFSTVSYPMNLIMGCISVSNGGWGYSLSGAGTLLFHCAHYDNDLGSITPTPITNVGDLALTGDPFVDAANGDFNIDTASAGGGELVDDTLAL